MADRDRQFDEQLRDVPVPSGMTARLREVWQESIADPSDDQIEDELKIVPLPQTLFATLKNVPDDVSLDERLLDVPIPRRLVGRLKTIAHRQPYRRLKRLAMAASLFLMISGSFWLFMSGMFASFRPRAPRDAVMIHVPYNGPLRVNGTSRNKTPSALALVVPPSSFPTELAVTEPRVEMFDPQSAMYGPAGDLWIAIDHGLDLWEDIFLKELRGAPHRDGDVFPELLPHRPLPRGGVSLPLVRQFNRKFFWIHGVHPPILPGAHPALRSISVPLNTATSTFVHAKRLVAEGRLPDAADIRVEDFLASVDYPFAKVEDGKIGLRVSAGPSLFSRESNPQLARELKWDPGPAGLLQIGVQVGRAPRDKGFGTHLTVAVDVSASMRWGNRIHMVQKALRRLLRNLSPHDRLSLIVFNERILHRVESIVADFDESVLDLIDGLEASGGTNLAGGLQQALSVALGDDIVQANLKRRMILLTDGGTKMDLHTKAKLCDLLHMAVEWGLEFSVFQLGEGAERDVLLDELATRAKGSLRQIENGNQLCWAVTETLIGRSSLIARDAVLTVKFRPESVAAYRLLGHESTGVGGLMPVAAETELRAGDGPSALLEVWLKPGSNNVIGEALVKWVDLETGKMHNKSLEITRLQFATSFSECSLSLQQAMLVAEAAEVLRDSPFVSPNSRDLSGVLRLADRVSPRLADRRGFQQFMRFVEEVTRLRARQ